MQINLPKIYDQLTPVLAYATIGSSLMNLAHREGSIFEVQLHPKLICTRQRNHILKNLIEFYERFGK